ncbi:MAG TPA: hypothetical protein VNH18_32940 [Bryobacteraceae bacterium]|nr:hypothetical protein [Bryobacteraceae bacterium]
MRILLTMALATAVMAQAQRPNPQPDKTFVSAAEVQAMIAKAKAERKPDQANFNQPLLRLAPYGLGLEYRVEGVDSPATLHEKEAEMIYVVDGGGTLTTGGKLIGEKRSNASNLAGTGVEGGEKRNIAKGDFIFVPENTAHSFTQTKGTLVIVSFHVPRGEKKE